MSRSVRVPPGKLLDPWQVQLQLSYVHCGVPLCCPGGWPTSRVEGLHWHGGGCDLSSSTLTENMQTLGDPEGVPTGLHQSQPNLTDLMLPAICSILLFLQAVQAPSLQTLAMRAQQALTGWGGTAASSFLLEEA
jgi:hypothetical protein